MKKPLLVAVLGSLVLAPFAAAQTGTISTVSPASAVQGTSNLTVTFTLASPPPVPPVDVVPASVTIGSLGGTSIAHPTATTVTAVFSIPLAETAGAKDCTVTFSSPAISYTKSGGFTVTVAANSPPSIVQSPQSQTVAVGEPVAFTVAASGSAPLSYKWQKDTVDIGGATGTSYTIASVAAGDAGSYRCVVTNDHGTATSGAATLTVDESVPVVKAAYPIVDTMQSACYDASAAVACPSAGQPFHGQDAQHQGYAARFTKSADGLAVLDAVTGLTWQHSPDTGGDGTITSADKLTFPQAQARPAALNAALWGGYSDWRLPTIRELYSLMDFRGGDPSGYTGTDTSVLTPFIDETVFDFAYGDTAAGERVIDAQYASSNVYVLDPSDSGTTKLFGVNFADGRIKGYDLVMPGGSAKTFFVQCVRGGAGYGLNAFVDNGDQTVTDHATGLVWAKGDSGAAMSWQDALAWVQAKNAAGWLGYADWRLPNAKELHSILDYSRSPDTSGSAALDPLLVATSFTNEGGTATDYPWYWASTTHGGYNGGGNAGVYLCFGRALGWQKIGTDTCYTLRDVHGAGAQRSDPKSGSLATYALGTACSGGTAYGNGPQGDVIRMTNYARLVRGGNGPLRAALSWAPASPAAGESVTFTAAASGGTSPWAYTWDLDGTPATGTSPSTSFAAGAHAITMTVTDAAGLVTKLTRALTVAGAGLVVSPTSGLTTTEAGGTASFTIVLASVPAADVTIGLTSSDPTEGTVAPCSVTFTPATWNVPKSVTVTGVDDAVADGPVGYAAVTAAAVSSDPGYSGLDPSDVSVVNVDDDGPAATAWYALTPCRVFDTRNTDGPTGGPVLGAGQVRTFVVAGACSIPAAAIALSGNLTVTQPAAAGLFRLYPGGGASGGTSTVAFPAGRTRANNVLVGLASDGSGTVSLANDSEGTAHALLDVTGYFARVGAR